MFEDLTTVSIAVGIIFGAIILSWVIGIAIKQLDKRYFAKTATELDNVLIGSIQFPLRIAIIVLGIQIAIEQIEKLQEILLPSIDGIFFVIYLFLVYVAFYRLIGGLSDWYAAEVVEKTETELDDKFLSFFRALAYSILTVIVIVILLGNFGIELSALVTTLGIGTLAVALAAQETLSDFISGFMIMLDQPFSVGDRVELLDIDTWGDVTEIGLRSTRILTRDNRLVSVPNSVIGKGLVVNYSDPNTVYRVQTHVGVAYGSDIDQARQVMVQAIMAEEWVMHEKPVEALMLEFGDSAMIFRVRCWIEDYIETRRVLDKMNTALYKALNKAEIEIPMPQRVVQLSRNTLVPEQADHSRLSGKGQSELTSK
ncbi:MAG: mechanosensitive ion channel family protein [Anaerolineae bacterium]|nr:MAG: mechanosensitive ion channel family protein [Anaerolineae bacterium]